MKKDKRKREIDNTIGIRHEPESGRLKRWAGLVLGILLVLFFMLYLGPWIGKSSLLRPMTQFIKDNDIDANQYFYTDVEEFSEGELNIQSSMDFAPDGP